MCLAEQSTPGNLPEPFCDSWEEQLVSEEKPVSNPSSLEVISQGGKKKILWTLNILRSGKTAHQ